jgi:hypothetical protein
MGSWFTVSSLATVAFRLISDAKLVLSDAAESNVHPLFSELAVLGFFFSEYLARASSINFCWCSYSFFA